MKLNNLKATTLLLALGLGISSCVNVDKVEEQSLASTNIKDAKVSDDFTWSTAATKSFQVNLIKANSCNNSGTSEQTVVLLDPAYKTITKVLSENGAASLTAQLPASYQNIMVYLPETGVIKTFSVNQASINIELPCLDGDRKGYAAEAKQSKTFFKAGPDCATGCTRTISGTVTNGNTNINDGEIVCVTGTYSGNFTVNGKATLRICGTVNLSNLNINSNGKDFNLIVAENGTLNASNLNFNNAKDNFYNYGTTNISGNFNPGKGININYKKLKISGNFAVNSNSSFVNDGELTIAGNFDNNKLFENKPNAKITIGGNLTNNSNGDFTNACSITVAGNVTHNDKFVNSGYVKANGKITINSSARITMVDGAQMSGKDLDFNGEVSCTGIASVLKISASTSINSSAKVKTGTLDICDANGIETNNGGFGANVVYCESYIPIDECNPEGFGTPKIVDGDGDGVADSEDAFPNDASLAFINSYPYNGFITNAYEDLWPSTGDYDFNDLVLKYKVQYLKNANNKITQANFEVLINAVGGSLPNGFGVNFLEYSATAPNYRKINNTIVTAATGQLLGIEGGNVVKVSNDVVKSLSSYYNNVGEGAFPSKAPDTLRFTVKFNPSAVPTNLIADLFIFRSNQRGLEIHLPNRPATQFVDASLFKTFEDNSYATPNSTYKTKNNLPWAIEVMTTEGSFRHPLSKVSITDAYPNFMNWVESGGTNSDWYTRPNFEKIFNK